MEIIDFDLQNQYYSNVIVSTRHKRVLLMNRRKEKC